MPTRCRPMALLVVSTLALALGCGDDSSGAVPADAGESRADSGSSDPTPFRPRPVADSGPTTPGEVGQDEQCVSQEECVEGLACVATEFQGLSICAQPCETHSDCGEDRCVTRSGDPADQHCTNSVTEEFGLCGLAVTAACGRGRTCLLVTDFVGVCVDLCPLGAGDGDGGVDSTDPGLVECKAEQTCIDLLANAGGRGVCMTVGARGDECGYDIGVDCDAPTDICAPVDASDPSAGAVCAQDCTDRNVSCDTGTCRDFQGQFAYCR